MGWQISVEKSSSTKEQENSTDIKLKEMAVQENSTDIKLKEMDVLTKEIRQRSQFQTTIIQIHIALFGITIAAALANRPDPAFILIAAITAPAFGLLWLDHANAIDSIARYIATDIELSLNRGDRRNPNLLHWEQGYRVQVSRANRDEIGSTDFRLSFLAFFLAPSVAAILIYLIVQISLLFGEQPGQSVCNFLGLDFRYGDIQSGPSPAGFYCPPDFVAWKIVGLLGLIVALVLAYRFKKAFGLWELRGSHRQKSIDDSVVRQFIALLYAPRSVRGDHRQNTLSALSDMPSETFEEIVVQASAIRETLKNATRDYNILILDPDDGKGKYTSPYKRAPGSFPEFNELRPRTVIFDLEFTDVADKSQCHPPLRVTADVRSGMITAFKYELVGHQASLSPDTGPPSSG